MEDGKEDGEKMAILGDAVIQLVVLACG